MTYLKFEIIVIDIHDREHSIYIIHPPLSDGAGEYFVDTDLVWELVEEVAGLCNWDFDEGEDPLGFDGQPA